MRIAVLSTVLTLGLILDNTQSAQPGIALSIADEHDKPTAARLRLFDSHGRALPIPAGEPLVLIHPRFPELGSVVSGRCLIQPPAGQYALWIERSTEYRRSEIKVGATVSTQQQRTIRLQRWIDMAARGWWSGDMHVHRDPAHMVALMEASDLHFAPTITRWNTQSNLDPWPARKIYTSGTRAYSIDNCEDERGWGAALFFDVKSPLRLYSAKTERDYPPPSTTWKEGREKGAFIDLEKAIWWSAPVVAALTPPDSVGVAVNHFLEEGMLDSEASGRPRDKTAYPGQRGFADYIFDLYYTYLNSGQRLPASAGSANGVLRNPLGYNRSYVFLGNRFSFESWLAGQKAGHNFVTNGPMLFLTVNGQGPGAVLPDDTAEVVVKLEALSAAELEKAQVVVDGLPVRAFYPTRDPARITGSVRLRVRRGSWLAARCFEKNPATVRFAHSSPVYIGRTPLRSPKALQFMRDWIDAEMERISSLTSITESQRNEMLELCRRARKTYR